MAQRFAPRLLARGVRPGVVVGRGLVMLAVLASCADPAAGPTPASGVGPLRNGAATDAKTSVADGAADAVPGASTDGPAPADVSALTGSDTEPDLVDAAAADDTGDIDWSALLDKDGAVDVEAPPLDGGAAGPVGHLYAHTADALFRLDLATKAIVEVGKFTFDKSKGLVTDIAVDAGGKLYAVTHTDVFVCGIANAKCAWIADLPSPFNGLTFVPKGTVDPGADVLVGIGETGSWNHIQIAGGKTTIKKLGNYPAGWLSSGDAFSVDGIGTYATLKGKSPTDTLVRVNPKTGAIDQFVGETGVDNLFGLAWWQGVFYAFSSAGMVYTLDVQTGKATPVQGIAVPKGVKWWGAGVSTRANGG
ncbi:MAG: hypothetical protein EXR79_02135 [Myxococcales bacterium]|nr:hypothetical protein [Myxococcales bacterium]